MDFKNKQDVFEKTLLYEWKKKNKRNRKDFWGKEWCDMSYKDKGYCLTAIPDGTISSSDYGNNNKKIKIMYIAKEPPKKNCTERYRDIDDFQSNDPDSYWSYLQKIAWCILNEEYFLYKAPDPVENNDYKELKETTAWVNVQKFPARGTTKNMLLGSIYKQYECNELLKEQIKMLEPTIIITVGSELWDLTNQDFSSVFFGDKNVNLYPTEGSPERNARNPLFIAYTKDKLGLSCKHIGNKSRNKSQWAQNILIDYKYWLDNRCKCK